MTPDELSERLLDFTARVGKRVDALPETRLGKHIAGQRIRCGTSPAPNDAEGCAAESRADFVHKLSICLKEMRESKTWIRLIIKSELLSASRVEQLLDENLQLCNILAQSLVTAKKRAESFPSSNLQFSFYNFQFAIFFLVPNSVSLLHSTATSGTLGDVEARRKPSFSIDA